MKKGRLVGQRSKGERAIVEVFTAGNLIKRFLKKTRALQMQEKKSPYCMATQVIPGGGVGGVAKMQQVAGEGLRTG